MLQRMVKKICKIDENTFMRINGAKNELMTGINVVYDVILKVSSLSLDIVGEPRTIEIWRSPDNKETGLIFFDRKLVIQREFLNTVSFIHFSYRGQAKESKVMLNFTEKLYFFNNNYNIPKKSFVIPKGSSLHSDSCEIFSFSIESPRLTEFASSISDIWNVPVRFIEDSSLSY